MSYKESVKIYKDSFESQSALVNQTTDYFLKNYVRSKIGSKESFNGSFIPGKIYCFRYTPTETKKVFNSFPFVLCTDKMGQTDKRVLTGIDLAMTPPDKRLEILSSTYDYFEEIIKNNITGLKRGSVQAPLPLTYDLTGKLFARTGFKTSLKNFNPELIRDLAIISYDDWVKIPYMNILLAEGSNSQEIYTNYDSKI